MLKIAKSMIFKAIGTDGIVLMPAFSRGVLRSSAASQSRKSAAAGSGASNCVARLQPYPERQTSSAHVLLDSGQDSRQADSGGK